ncbi:MAG: zinc permease [Solirubrobacterales bacterium]|nr:zinc permease [Solirubrobacterales bacterium]
MSFWETTLLGGIAGFTIYIGLLPFGRMRILGDRKRVALAMFAVGILAFLFVDVLAHAFEIVEDSVTAFHDDEGSLGSAIGLTALLGVGFAIGSGALASFEARLRGRAGAPPPIAGGAVAVATPGQEANLESARVDAAHARALRTGMTIAAAIGVHNFAEGLAIGVSANTGEIGLATVLIIGFAAHNATEGFGILGPLGGERASWRWLLLAGLVAGGPVLLGSMIGYSVDSEPLELAFLAVAGGAIIYVIGQVWNAIRRFGHRELGLWLLAAGFMAGVVTDLIVAYSGG